MHTNVVIFILQVVFDSLFGEITNTKLRSLTLQFIYHICSRYTNTQEALFYQPHPLSSLPPPSPSSSLLILILSPPSLLPPHPLSSLLPPSSSSLLTPSFLLPCSSSEQKLAVMAPVLLTGLNKIVDQPEEVSVSVMCEGVRDVKHVSFILILYLS